MTRRLHVLTAGFSSPNGRAFLMPLILHRQALEDAGLSVRLSDRPASALTDCDALLLDGKYFSPRWAAQSEAALEEIAGYGEKVRNLIYVDLLDSAGWDHARALPHVTLYCKPQLLRDRSAYLRPLYGYRAYADYYHKEMGVDDEPPVWSEPAADAGHLDKLTVAWNSALADYSWLGPMRMAAYGHVPFRPLLRFPGAFHPPPAERPIEVSCRIGTDYVRESVRFQRKRMAAILAGRMQTGKLSRRDYLVELSRSKIVVSPFGYGEITLRDFEILMSGAVMLKPDMSGLETWPDLYRDGETMVAHRWDLSDVDEKIEKILSNHSSHLAIAAQGQDAYRRHLCGEDAGALFAQHLSGIIAKGDRMAARSQ